MGIIKDFLAKKKERESELKDYEYHDKIIGHVEEKKKSHAERELIKILEEERQQCMKEALHWENKKRAIEDKIKARKMLKFDSSMFNNKNILQEKNAFLRGGDF